MQKSVANNLNDISKIHPELVGKITNIWYGDISMIIVEEFKLDKSSSSEDILFVIYAKQMMKVRLEYNAIDCIKANSKRNRKIFKIF